jgi:hypothetical protein
MVQRVRIKGGVLRHLDVSSSGGGGCGRGDLRGLGLREGRVSQSRTRGNGGEKLEGKGREGKERKETNGSLRRRRLHKRFKLSIQVIVRLRLPLLPRLSTSSSSTASTSTSRTARRPSDTAIGAATGWSAAGGLGVVVARTARGVGVGAGEGRVS